MYVTRTNLGYFICHKNNELKVTFETHMRLDRTLLNYD